MEAKPVLAFDCAAPRASIALRMGNVTDTVELAQGKQSAELVASIDTLMQAHGLNYDDLGCIVSTIGPGSFTGIRIGLAALHGFALASGCAIKTLTSLEAMGWQVARESQLASRFITALRAGKGEIYAQEFEVTDAMPKALGEIFLAPETKTDFDLPLYANLDATSPYFLAGPDASTLCAIASHLPVSDLSAALPAYIRPPDAKIPTKLHWL